MHILDVLESICSSSLSEYEKERNFEKLIQAWLLLDPVLSPCLAEVWLGEAVPTHKVLQSMFSMERNSRLFRQNCTTNG